MKSKWASYILLLLLAALVFSCSVSNNYKTLSFFFDGVPDTSDKAIAGKPLSNGELTDTINHTNDSTLIIFDKIFYHDPYRFKGCSNCHDSKAVGNMISDEPDLCYQCHENFGEKYQYTHGPVDGGFCTVCHNPHSGKNKFLLNDEERKLCLYCHNQSELPKTGVHNLSEDFRCIDCHNPHGGENRLMLDK